MRSFSRALAALGSVAALSLAVLSGTPAFASGQQSASCHPGVSYCSAGPIAVLNPGQSGTIHVATSGLAGVTSCVSLQDNNTGVWVLHLSCDDAWLIGNQSYWVSGLYGTSYTAWIDVETPYAGTLYVANY